MALDYTKPVQTRDGRPVTILTFSGRGDWPIIGYISDSEYLTAWAENGKLCLDPAAQDNEDLVNVPQHTSQTFYFRVYDNEVILVDEGQTRSDASVDFIIENGRIVDITWNLHTR